MILNIDLLMTTVTGKDFLVYNRGKKQYREGLINVLLDWRNHIIRKYKKIYPLFVFRELRAIDHILKYMSEQAEEISKIK